jgi:hypothetical protein
VILVLSNPGRTSPLFTPRRGTIEARLLAPCFSCSDALSAAPFAVAPFHVVEAWLH